MDEIRHGVNRWQSKVDALIRLAEDQKGKPEGELAWEKLRQILEKYPEAAQAHRPLYEFAEREFTTADLGYMIRHDISIDGRWTGRNWQEAILHMVAEYRARIDRFKNRPHLLGAGIAELINELKPWIK